MAKIKKVKKPRSKLPKIQKIKKKRKPRTAATVGTSMAEKEFKAFINSIGVQVDEQFQILYKFYDFIVKDLKLIIEFDGDYWHCNPAVYPNGPENKMQKAAITNDRYKTGLAEGRGYTLVRVWEKEFNEDKPAVEARILEAIKKQQLKEIRERTKVKKP